MSTRTLYTSNFQRVGSSPVGHPVRGRRVIPPTDLMSDTLAVNLFFAFANMR